MASGQQTMCNSSILPFGEYRWLLQNSTVDQRNILLIKVPRYGCSMGEVKLTDRIWMLFFARSIKESLALVAYQYGIFKPRFIRMPFVSTHSCHSTGHYCFDNNTRGWRFLLVQEQSHQITIRSWIQTT